MTITSFAATMKTGSRRSSLSAVVVVVSAVILLLSQQTVNASYLRRTTSSMPHHLDELQEQLEQRQKQQQAPRAGKTKTTINATAKPPRRRFYVRYDGEEGRNLVQHLCGSEKIVEDLNETGYTLLVDDDADDSHNSSAVKPCWERLQESSDIAFIEEDYPVQAFAMEKSEFPNDGSNVAAEGQQQEDIQESWGIAAIQADQLDMGKHDVTVCVIDTGIAAEHPDFDYDRISGVDQMDRPNPWYWSQDRVGHGTHVGGIIAASSNNGYGVKGVGDFSLLIVRGLGDDGSGYESDIWKAVEACIDHGADIINMSLGNLHMSKTANEVYTKAVEEHGIVLVAASGNDNDSTKYFPASHPNVISVGAMGSNGNKYFSSNFNDQVEFVAPGQDIVSTTVSTNAIHTPNFSYPANTVMGATRSFAAGMLAVCDMKHVAEDEKCEEAEEQQDSICMFAMEGDTMKDGSDLEIEDLIEICYLSGGIGAVVYDISRGGRFIPNLYAVGASQRSPIPAIAISKTTAYQILESIELKSDGDTFQVSVGDTGNDRIEYTFAMLSGTSMAAPYVTAAFGLIKSHFPECSQWQIRKAFAETSLNPDGAHSCNAQYGYGLIQVRDAYDWLVDKGDCNSWIPEEVSSGGCKTRVFTPPTPQPTSATTPNPTPHPTMSPTEEPTSSPTVQEADEPTTQEPSTAAPTTEAPVTAAPTTEAPISLVPTTAAPTAAPTTLVSSPTNGPETPAPTVPTPTTEPPVSSPPSTQAPVTQAPTVSPITSAPTSVSTTTSTPSLAPTTVSTEGTDVPSTSPPTTLRPAAVRTVTPTTIAPTPAEQPVLNPPASSSKSPMAPGDAATTTTDPLALHTTPP